LQFLIFDNDVILSCKVALANQVLG